MPRVPTPSRPYTRPVQGAPTYEEGLTRPLSEYIPYRDAAIPDPDNRMAPSIPSRTSAFAYGIYEVLDESGIPRSTVQIRTG